MNGPLELFLTGNFGEIIILNIMECISSPKITVSGTSSITNCTLSVPQFPDL